MKSFCFFSSLSRDNDEVLHYQKAEELIKDGYSVTYVVCDNKPDEIISGVKVTGIGTVQKGYLNRLFKTPKILRNKLFEVDADVYQTTCLELLPICNTLQEKGKGVIFELREGHPYTFYSKSHLPKAVSFVVVQFMILWMRYFLRRIDSVITVSEDIAKYLKEWHIPKVQVFGNFPKINPAYSLSLRDYLSRKDCALYYGSIYAISRQECFMDALESVGNVDYLLAGKFRNDSYEMTIKSHPFWSNVRFINGFKKEDIYDFFRQSTFSNVLRDFSSLKSSNGSLGVIKMFESMEAALPLICSDVQLYRDLMKEYPCGILVDPNNPKEIEDAIRYLINHKEEAWKMGQEGRRAVIEKYSWDALAPKYLAIVNSLSSKPKNKS